jgi:hypothetical protein
MRAGDILVFIGGPVMKSLTLTTRAPRSLNNTDSVSLCVCRGVGVGVGVWVGVGRGAVSRSFIRSVSDSLTCVLSAVEISDSGVARRERFELAVIAGGVGVGVGGVGVWRCAASAAVMARHMSGSRSCSQTARHVWPGEREAESARNK